MDREEIEKMFLELNSVLVKFWKEQGRPDKEIKVELLERMLDWYKKMGYITMDKQQPSLPSNIDEAADEYGRKEYSHAIHFWDEGFSRKRPELMKEDFVKSFKAGAEWMAAQQEQVQPEVDLEKGLIQWHERHFKKKDTYVKYSGFYLENSSQLDLAHHFYGLRNRALEEAARHVYESWMGGTMDDVRRDMVELGKVLNARKK